MKLNGAIQLAVPGGCVWDLIVDPVSLASCVPGVQELRQVDPQSFQGTVLASVGPIDGRFTFTSHLESATYPNLLVRINGVDSVSNSPIEAEVNALVVEVGDESRIEYRADVRVKGRLAILGEMILRATASLMIGEVSRCLKSRLEPQQPPLNREGQ